MATEVNARCPNPTCGWVGRVRTVNPSLVGLGQGVFGMLRLVCECRTELDTEVVTLAPA